MDWGRDRRCARELVASVRRCGIRDRAVAADHYISALAAVECVCAEATFENIIAIATTKRVVVALEIRDIRAADLHIPDASKAKIAFGGVKGRTQLPGMVEDAMKGEIDLAPFVTHTMGLDKINDAFDLMHEGKSIRTVIHY